MEGVFGVIAFVKNQGERLALRSQRAVAGLQVRNDGSEGDRIGLIAGVDLEEKRNMEIGGDEQSQTDHTQIGAFGFGMTALRERRGGGRIDEGVEVGAIKAQAAQIQLKLFDQPGGKIPLDRPAVVFIDDIHVIPEALATELSLGTRQQSAQDGGAVPGAQAGFAGRSDDAIDCGQDEVFSDREALIAFGGVAIDEIHQPQFLDQGPAGDDGPEIEDFSLERVFFKSLEAFPESIGGTEMSQEDMAGLAVDEARGDQLPVAFSVDGFREEARHCLVHIIQSL